MTFDTKELLMRPVGHFDRWKAAGLKEEMTDAMWADAGQTMHKNLMKPGELERIFTTMALRGTAAAEIMRAIRIYVISGVKP